MKILIIMDPSILIPVTGYGGHERLVEMFAKEYTNLGHDVHLLVTDGSHVPGCTMHELGKAGFPPAKKDAYKAIWTAWKFLQKHKADFDLIHNFGRLIYLLPVLNAPVKKIMTYGREITSRNIKWINAWPNKNVVFTGCSQNLINRVEITGAWEVIYNACDFSKYELQKEIAADAPLIFLGRIEKIKGCHTAIRVAKATGNKLIIAGNISALPEENEYYENEIAPLIDGNQIKYIGAVNDEQKNEWLGKSKALLFPIEWNEPFGIVMVEAMACGTPVIAMACGSVDEVVQNGVTGFKVNAEDEMIAAVHKINTISRSACRAYAMERFDVRVIARQYLAIFNERKKIVILSTHQPAANPRAMKEYVTLKEMGYAVKFLYGYNIDWSYKIDEDKFDKGSLHRQELIEVGGNPHKYPFKYFINRLQFWIIKRLSFFKLFKNISFNRVSVNLLAKVKNYPADLYIAHYLGALPAALTAGKSLGVPFIFDAEDFHRGEKAYYDDQINDVVAVENYYLPQVSSITTASPLISAEYKKYYPSQRILTVNNVFSKKYLQPVLIKEPGTLKLFWFSQHIGVGRGLEIFIEALNHLSDEPVTLTIMGNVRSEIYRQQLISAAFDPTKLFFKDTVAPEDIFGVASQFDVGLAGEIPNFKNKELCLSNKIFTYLMAGNCLLVSDMQGQKELFDEHPGMGFIYKHDDAQDLADKIKMLLHDAQLLQNCKVASRKLAAEKLNWEVEQTSWLNMINDLLITPKQA